MRPLRASWFAPVAVAVAGFLSGYLSFLALFPVAPRSPVPPLDPPPEGSPTRVSQAPVDRVAALLAACRERDPLRRDAALFQAIERLQPDDLASLAGDPAALLSRVEKVPWAIRRHMLEAILERWVDVDPEGALRAFGSPTWIAALGTLGAADPARMVTAPLLHVLARREPQWMFAHARTFSARNARQTALRTVFEQVAGRDPAQARRWLADLSAEDDRRSAERGFTRGLAGSDPAAALAFLRTEADPEKRAALSREFVQGSAGQSPALAREAIASAGEHASSGILAKLALGDAIRGEAPVPYGWLEETFASKTFRVGEVSERIEWEQQMAALRLRDPEGALAWVAGLSGPARERASASFFGGWAQSDPQRALAWLADEPGVTSEGGGAHLDAALQDIAALHPEEWQRWLAAQPEGPLRNRATLADLSMLAEAGRGEEAGAAYRRVLALDPGGRLAVEIGTALARIDGASAGAWVASLPEGVGRRRTAEAIGEAWSQRDPALAADWIERLPDDEVRDAAIGGYAIAVVAADVGAAAASVERIADTDARQRAAEKVFRAWQERYPPAARRWLRGLPGLDAAWKEATVQAAR